MKNLGLFVICCYWITGGVQGDLLDDVLERELSKLRGGWEMARHFLISDNKLDSILDKYIPDSASFDNDLCRNHSIIYRESLKKLSLWALKMFDSGSKIPDGLLMLNLVQYGNFDECLGVEDVQTQYGPFSGKYCLVNIFQRGQDVPMNQLEAEMKMMTNALDPEKVNATGLHIPVGLKGSVCVPSSCRGADVQAHLQQVAPMVGVGVEDITCTSRADPVEFEPLNWFALVFVIVVLTLVALSTCYDLLYPIPESRRQLLVAFSLYSNGKMLLNGPAAKDSLSAVHGVRCLSIMWIVLGHRLLWSEISPGANLAAGLQHVSDWKHIIPLNATLAVDSFLVISGLLVTYIFLKEMEKGTKFNLFVYYFHRFVRLSPAFAVIMLIAMSLMPYLGEGPFWKIAVDYQQRGCAEKWWKSLLYLGNYLSADVECLSHTWYLGVDMQLYWLSPLILFPLWKFPRFGRILLGLLIATGLAIGFIIPYVNKFSAAILFSYGDENSMFYVPTHARFVPWVVGVALGHILHTTKHRNVVLPRLVVGLGWAMALGLMAATILVSHIFTQPDHVYDRFFESLYKCLMRPVWALGVAWVIFACVKGYGGFVNSFLSWKVFLVMGRFSYTLYLIHVPIQSYLILSSKIANYNSDIIHFHRFCGDLAIALLFAILLTLTIETPTIMLEKALFASIRGEKKSPKTNEIKIDLNLNNEIYLKENKNFDNFITEGDVELGPDTLGSSKFLYKRK